ncbi:tetratricopeptide repeat protein [Niabella hirudinis]|uniref:tetratricopeptide repeat protein n=1 Tax=Niabella hirudinis TaxID=1285929 RepID=UPI003EBF8952
MKQIFTAGLFLMGSVVAFGQDQIALMRENARKFMMSGDIENAVLVLNKAAQTDKNNIDVQKDLALAYYYKKDYVKGLEIVKPLLASEKADVATYQLAGTLYRGTDNGKEAEKIYKTAIEKFPKQGPLYSEYGEVLEVMKNGAAAINMWEKGMEVAPSYSGNYYNAAIYYFKQPEGKIWAILYGEIYANMESLNPKSGNIKNMVLDAYKDLFSGNLSQTAANTKNEFAKAVLETFARQSGITAQGLTPETLAMIRTRFVLDWINNYNKKLPYRLFEYHQQLMRDGMFDAYNQWMFGPASNQAAFEKWAEANKAAYDKFTEFHKSRVFKMPAGQVYSNKK